MSDTKLDVQATRGVRELTRESAALMDRVIAATDRQPRSSQLVTVTRALLDGHPPAPQASVAPAPAAADLDGPPVDRVVSTVSRVVRDTELAARVKASHQMLCQLCGQTVRLADGSGYAEGHHLQPLGAPHNGPDVAANILCLCPNHHAACALGAVRLAAADLRAADGHVVGQQFLDYHNRVMYRGGT